MEFDNTLDVPLALARAAAVAMTPNKPISGFTLVLKTQWSAIVPLFRRNRLQS
jgi:hypothetical protein